ncbi:MAG: ferrous iron transport protein A [Phycisphaerae bacterium]
MVWTTMRDGGLLSLGVGDCGTIARVKDTQLASKRLADLGFIPGAQVVMVRPGSPCIVRIDGRCVGLGSYHQQAIELAPV